MYNFVPFVDLRKSKPYSNLFLSVLVGAGLVSGESEGQVTVLGSCIP